MSDSQANEPGGAPPETILVAVARAEGDPELFPDEVVRLHAQGEAQRARKLLLEHAGTERDPTRGAKQLRLADDLRLWLEPLRKAPAMHSVNGFGTHLYGSYQPASDGTYVATLWIVLLFLPVWPLGAYLVRPAEKSNAWYFLARAPLPPFARRMRRVTRSSLIALVGLLLWKAYWSGAHTDLYVFNGFDRPVIAHAGEQRSMVPGRRHAVFPDLPLATTRVGASWQDEAEPFESLAVDLAGHGRHTAVYNVADRAVLSLDYIVYGKGEAREGRWLERGPVIFLEERIDYLFATPPDSKRVSEGGRIENSMLSAVDEGAFPVDVVLALLQRDRVEQALAVAKAELLAHPENGGLAALAAQAILHDDFDAQLALLRWCLERAPDAVDVHRAYQDLWPEDRRDTVRREYAALLAKNLRSPMYHYLAGRLADDGSPTAAAHYRAALALDPRYAPVYRALGYEAIVRGAWAEALARYDRFASVGAAEGLEALDPRLRLRRRLGRPRAEMERVIVETAALRDESLALPVLRAHLRIEARAGAREGEVRRVLASIRSKRGLDSASPLARNVLAALAATAGDVPGARRALREMVRPEDRSAAVALRIASSDGGTREDVALLLEITGWQTELEQPQRLIALALLDSTQRRELIATLDPEPAAIARLLETPGELVRPERLAQALSRQALDVRTAAYFAAARALASLGDPRAANARHAYLDEARSFALPGELPYGGGGSGTRR